MKQNRGWGVVALIGSVLGFLGGFPLTILLGLPSNAFLLQDILVTFISGVLLTIGIIVLHQEE